MFWLQAHKKCGLYEFPLCEFTALLGTSYKFENVERVPKNVPFLIIKACTISSQ
jgi:1-acyl-sn-glycerol-3-phosphate acyltransferase